MTPTTRLVILVCLRWFPVGLVIPVQILLLSARGLTLAQVGQLMAVYGITTLLMELPTGGLADSWGRRPVVVASALVQAVGFLILALSASLPAIVVALMLGGVSRALASGPVEAWFVDVSHSLGFDSVEPGLAKGQMAEALALGAGAVLGGVAPRFVDLPASGTGFIAFSVPFAAAAGMGLVFALTAALLLTGDTRSRGRVGRTIGQAARVAVREPRVRRLLLVALCLGVLLSGVELVSPDRVAQLVGSPTDAAAIFGVLAASAFVVSALGAGISTRVPGRRAVVAAAAYGLSSVFVLALALPWIGAAALTYLAVYLMIGLQGPVTAALLHARVTSSMRSTMLSVESLALQAGGAAASVAVGWLVTQTGLLSGLSVLAVAGLVAAGLLVRDVRHQA